MGKYKDIEFVTFTEFCENMDKLLYYFKKYSRRKDFNLKEIRDYIYNDHNFSDSKMYDTDAKNKCWEWFMSYKYEKVPKNDMYSCLGHIKKGR